MTKGRASCIPSRVGLSWGIVVIIWQEKVCDYGEEVTRIAVVQSLGLFHWFVNGFDEIYCL